MLIETLVFTLFGLLLGATLWWIWRERQMAQRQAEMNERLATIGKTVDGVSHDLAQLAGIIATNLELAREHSPEQAREMFGEAEQAAQSVRHLIDVVRKRPLPSGRGSVDGILRMTVALQRHAEAQIAADIQGDLSFEGAQIDAQRVIQNLLSNAVRETAKIPGAVTSVVLRDGTLRITNPVLAPGKLDESIYEWGVSHSGSSGTGLAASRELATRLGWTLRHEVEGDSVTFILEHAKGHPPVETA